MTNIHIDAAEVLRYLGIRDPQLAEAQTTGTVKRLSEGLKSVACPLSLHGVFSLVREERGIRLDGTSVVLQGRDVAALLDGCTECVLMAATLGQAADRFVDYHMTRAPSDGVVADACAIALIEAYCDGFEAELTARYGKLTFRYAPGYGDLPLEIQPKLLAALNAPKKIGLSTNSGGMMIPVKSVTAVLGIEARDKRTVVP